MENQVSYDRVGLTGVNGLQSPPVERPPSVMENHNGGPHVQQGTVPTWWLVLGAGHRGPNPGRSADLRGGRLTRNLHDSGGLGSP